MAKQHQVQATHLTANQRVFVEGLLSFNRISSLITGKEREEANARAARVGSFQNDYDYTRVVVTDAKIIQGDPAAPTREEFFLIERLYEKDGVQNFSHDNKSSQLPPVFIQNDAGQYQLVKDLAGDLASGTPVLLELETYKPKNFPSHGYALRRIFIKQKGAVPYRSNASVDLPALSAIGITFADPAEALRPAQEGSAPAAEAPPANSIVNDEGLALPGAIAPAPVAPQAFAAPVAAPQFAPTPAVPSVTQTQTDEAAAKRAELQRQLAALDSEVPAPDSAGSAFTAPTSTQPWDSAEAPAAHGIVFAPSEG